MTKRQTQRHYSDLGPKETVQHGGIVIEDTEVAGIKRARRRDWIEEAFQHDRMTSAQYGAAGLFKQDFHDAHLEISCERQEKVDGSKTYSMAERTARAKKRLNDLHRQVEEWEWFCLWYCIGHERSAEDTARIARWTVNPFSRLPTSKDTVRKYTMLALDGAAKFYRVG